MGFEMFNEIDPEYYGKSAARQAYTMLHARNCPAGRMTVAIDNGLVELYSMKLVDIH